MRKLADRKAVCNLPEGLSGNIALDRIEAVLTAEHVQVERSLDAICSTRIPAPLLGIDPRLYSRRNWVGMNPFLCLSSVVVRLLPDANKPAQVEITLSRARGFVRFGLAVVLFACVATAVSLVPNIGAFAWLGAAVLACALYLLFVPMPTWLAVHEMSTSLLGSSNGLSPLVHRKR